MNKDAIIIGLVSGMFGMLLMGSIVINAAIGRPQECIVKYGTRNYESIMVGRYELKGQHP